MQRFVLTAMIAALAPGAWGLTSYGDPASYVATIGSHPALSGVVQLSSVGCSGALLYTQMHILTAAHCLDGGVVAGTVQVNFLGGGTVFGSAIHLAPGWSADLLAGNDIAILTLATAIDPLFASGYGLYTANDEQGQTAQLAGYGIGGQGQQNPGTYPYSGTLRTGQNLYDATGGDFGNVDDRIVLGDFDNGETGNDAMALLGPSFANTDNVVPNILAMQVMVAPGDSGGPSFLGGLLAGVHSFRATLTTPPNVSNPDINLVLDSSFGEVFGDTRVSQHADWIESVLVPEPGSFVLAAIGLAALGFRARRRH